MPNPKVHSTLGIGSTLASWQELHCILTPCLQLLPALTSLQQHAYTCCTILILDHARNMACPGGYLCWRYDLTGPGLMSMRSLQAQVGMAWRAGGMHKRTTTAWRRMTLSPSSSRWVLSASQSLMLLCHNTMYRPQSGVVFYRWFVHGAILLPAHCGCCL